MPALLLSKKGPLGLMEPAKDDPHLKLSLLFIWCPGREDGGVSGVSSSCGARGGFLPRHDEDLREPCCFFILAVVNSAVMNFGIFFSI